MAEGWGKVLIGTRLEKVVSASFLQTWERITLTGLRKGDACYSVRGLVSHLALNKLVRVLLKSDCDSLLTLDSDAVVDANIISQFADYEPGWEYDALQAFYCRRGWPPSPIWLKENALGQVGEFFIMRADHHEKVAVVGTHCAIFRRRMFEEMLGDGDPETHHWFYYPMHETTSEDAAFSRDARNAGYKLGATTAIQAGHLGELETNWNTYMDYLQKTGRIALLARYQKLAALVSEFTGEDPEIVAAKAMTGDIRTADAWREKDPKTPEEVREYYQSANDYLYDLLQWNSEPLYQRVVEPLLQVSGRKVLSIGPGLGTECAMAMKGGNEVHAFELDGVLKDFLKFRFGDDVTFITWPPKEQYDVVTVIDVIEHIHPEEVRGFLATVDKAITPGGYLICHYTGPMSGIPQHFNNDAVYEEWIEGYTKIGEFLWRKHEDSHGES